MARKKTTIATGKKKKTSKTKETKAESTKREKSYEIAYDSGLIIIDDDLMRNKEMEMEERRLYLEEARSQESFD
ncbi:MAG TPA: hypothetical protein OQH54_03450 [Nitrosopumilus sp.]|nr:hypothetical protein [Thermoproteota archaeon]HJJ22755.1 hypothetical protein [Nitrosopumilus sp.]